MLLLHEGFVGLTCDLSALEITTDVDICNRGGQTALITTSARFQHLMETYSDRVGNDVGSDHYSFLQQEFGMQVTAIVNYDVSDNINEYT